MVGFGAAIVGGYEAAFSLPAEAYASSGRSSQRTRDCDQPQGSTSLPSPPVDDRTSAFEVG